MRQHPAVFLDRDGTMIEDVGYLDRLERLKLFPYTVDAVRLLNRAGFKVVVVTSQNGVAQGMLTEEFLSETHAHLSRLFEAAGGRVDGYYYCPHSPQAVVERYRTECECRKPKPGMILAAAKDLGLDLQRSFVIGDRWRDIEMGLAAGTSGVLVQTGYGKTQASRPPATMAAVPVVANLIEAVSLVLRGVCPQYKNCEWVSTHPGGEGLILHTVRAIHPLPAERDLRTRLLGLLDAFPARRVAVIGDLIADEFIYGRVARVSREAPVLILQYDSTEILPGGAGNAANNVAALGARTRVIGVSGDDEPGKRLRASLRHLDTRGLVRQAGYATPVKTRILAGGVHTAKQQIVRIDRVVSTEYDARSRAAFARAALKAARECEAVLLSDYGTGLVTAELARALTRAIASRARRRPVPILLDSRYDLLRYRGLTACTPNESEVEQMLGVKIGDSPRALERAGRALLERTRMNAVLITRGSRGMALFEVGRPTSHVPIYGSDEVADVTGAGDTVIATMTLALAAGGSSYEAARLANYAGGLVVMKRGTATVSPEELRAAILKG